ncbi:MAG TPA: hypothetical protein VFX49_21140 [Chloroflexota bacterium]|nr:hypothetical protein [Chloroflexota bacterium]
MMALTPLYRATAAKLGYADPLYQLPELSALVAAVNMTLPMVLWMRLRGMSWRLDHYAGHAHGHAHVGADLIGS